MNEQPQRALFAADALLPGGWAGDVLLRWDERGMLVSVQSGIECPPQVRRAPGPVVPGIPNLHSHAFQRAFAGLTEYRGQKQDSFWSWRTLMYGFAGRLTPQTLQAVASWLYLEMLEAGYTSVCEFHYVHHGAQGRVFADDGLLSEILLSAAARVGIGMTLLPVLYQSSGFGGRPAHQDQARFIRSTDNMLALLQRLLPDVRAHNAALGLAPHSLRAVPPESLHIAVEGLHALVPQAPVHIHVAEQLQEVSDCLAWSGQRPVQWLLEHAPVDARWCLIHATHMLESEYQGAAASGAVAGLCPSTEANLGDGVFDARRWTKHGGRWGIGSDSHVCVNAAEELLMLEYSQRLACGERNVLSTPGQPQVATAMTLAAVAGGAQASGRPVAGLACGQQADWQVLDAGHVALAGLDAPQAYSSHVFASQRSNAILEVWVAGQRLVEGGRHTLHEELERAFCEARSQLLAGVR